MNLEHLPGSVRALFDYNRWSTLFVSTAIVLGIWLGGCESMTLSPVTRQKTTQSNLQLEEQAWLVTYKARHDALELEGKQMAQKFQLAYDDIKRKDSIRQGIFDTLTVQANSAAAGTPFGWIAALIAGMAATGFKLDANRKDRVISSQQTITNTMTDVATSNNTVSPATAEKLQRAGEPPKL